MSSIPSWGTKIPYAKRPKKKMKNPKVLMLHVSTWHEVLFSYQVDSKQSKESEHRDLQQMIILMFTAYQSFKFDLSKLKILWKIGEGYSLGTTGVPLLSLFQPSPLGDGGWPEFPHTQHPVHSSTSHPRQDAPGSHHPSSLLTTVSWLSLSLLVFNFLVYTLRYLIQPHPMDGNVLVFV